MDVFRLLETGWFGLGSHPPTPSSEPVYSYESTSEDSHRQPTSTSNLQHSRKCSENSPTSTQEQDVGDGHGFPAQSALLDSQEGQKLTPSLPVKPGQSPVLSLQAAGHLPHSVPRPITPTRPPPHRSPRRVSASPGVDELPGFGSWAHRQFHFKQASPPGATQAQPASHSVTRLGPAAQSRSRRTSESEDEDAARQAAWRWRFRSRWAQEQARHMDPDRQTLDDELEAWDEALGFLDACGPVSRGHIARTVSTEHNLGQSLRSCGSGLSSAGMLDESQHDGSVLREAADMDATRALSSIARRAQDLFKQQQQIEKQVEQRWCGTRGNAWVGGQMPRAAVDKFGKCPFVLVRVVEREPGPQCLLVRSTANSSEAGLVAAVVAEAQQVRASHHLPPVQVRLLGSGLLQWTSGRHDSVSILSGSTADASQHSPVEIVRLTASVLRSSLPLSERISIAAGTSGARS